MPRLHSPDKIPSFTKEMMGKLIDTPQAIFSLRKRYELESTADGTVSIPAPDEMTTLDIQCIRWEIARVQRCMDLNVHYSKLCSQQLVFIHQMNAEKNSAKVFAEIEKKHPHILWEAFGKSNIRVVLQDVAGQLEKDIFKFAEEMVDYRSEMQLLEGHLAAEMQKCRECYGQILEEYGLMTEVLKL